MNKLIYIVDDEKNIRDLIKSYLEKEGFLVETFENGQLALVQFKSKIPDMLIIDIMMPGLDGYSLCKEIRKTSEVPIIFVSAKDEEIDRILGLELGSDDYISKPFSPRELVIRIKNIFKRIKEPIPKANCEPSEKIVCGDVNIFPEQRTVFVNNVELSFTQKEYELLAFLIENKNKVFNREQLIKNLWGYDYIGDTRSIDDLVKRIRKKLSHAESKLEISTVWGYGYKIGSNI